MHVMCDHPHWWVIMSLYGYSVHISVQDSLKILSEYKIFFVKEEGETSKVKQLYNQEVAISDKRMIRYFLDTVCNH